MFLVLELIDGESLAARIRREGVLPAVEAARIVLQAARGLDAAWAQGVVHRDVKPANLMVTPAGIVKVVDFGLATEIDIRTDRAAGEYAGSIPFMAPEQAMSRDVDVRADLYALGVTLYALLAGRPPCEPAAYRAHIHQYGEAPPLPELPERVPDALCALVRAMTANSPADRPASPRVVADALAAWLTTVPPVPWALVADLDEERGRGRGGALALLELQPVVTTGGDDALAALDSRGPPAVVVTDLSLSRVDGFALLRAVRHLGGSTRVIVLTDFDELREVATARATELGIDLLHGSDVSDAWVASAAHALLTRTPVPPPRAAPPRPSHLRARLRLMEALGATPDAPADPELFALVAQVAATLGVSSAMISLVLPDRQHFVAHAGLAGDLLAQRGTAIADAFCRHVVESGAPLVVPDANNHPAFVDNRLVRSGEIGSYVGAPLRSPSGAILGTVCAIDREPVAFGRNDVAALGRLAARIAERLAEHLEAPRSRSEDSAVVLPSEALAPFDTPTAADTEGAGIVEGNPERPRGSR
jgi:CheY-like chemotaxis protein